MHCLWDAVCTSHLKEKNSAIGWGGVGSHSVCIAIGRLCGVTFCRSNSNNWSKVLITSGTNDAWVIPTSARMLFLQVRVKRQGHRCILDGPNPGLIIGDTGDFVPFVIEEETQFCMFPMYPPPTPLLDMQVYIHRLCAFSISKGHARAHLKRTPLSSTP